MWSTQVNKWIINGIIIASVLQCIKCIPANVTQNRESRDIHLGPCTWIINGKCPDSRIKFYLYTRENVKDRQLIYIGDTLEQSNLSSSYFNEHDPVKIIMHGYNSDMFLSPLIEMKDEYLRKNFYNLFYVDWSVLAPGPCYISSVYNTRHVGKCIAKLVERIMDMGSTNIHLIGFSLGAHLANFVASNLKPIRLPRITGLDPALPLFITASNENKLDASDADFVDVLHTNSLVQGKIERCGHIDFYFNGGIMQPGCFQSGQNPFACSHHRAPHYFSESIRSNRGFWGWACSSYINYLLGLCPPTNYLVLAGEDCKSDGRGMYLITTNSASPFATGRWTDLSMNNYKYKSSYQIKKPYIHNGMDPLQQQIDEWGKLSGEFNNFIDLEQQYAATPFSQDPNGNDWPYFNVFETLPLMNHHQQLNEPSSNNDYNDNEDSDGDGDDEDAASSIIVDSIDNGIEKVLNNNFNKQNNRFNQFNNNNNNNNKNQIDRKNNKFMNSLKRTTTTTTDRISFFEEYKQNMTKGINNQNIYQMPIYTES